MAKEILLTEQELDEAIKRTEKHNGVVENHWIKADSDNPDHERRSWKVVHNGVDKFAFRIADRNDANRYDDNLRDIKVVHAEEVPSEK
jgi:hypothetical protein